MNETKLFVEKEIDKIFSKFLADTLLERISLRRSRLFLTHWTANWPRHSELGIFDQVFRLSEIDNSTNFWIHIFHHAINGTILQINKIVLRVFFHVFDALNIGCPWFLEFWASIIYVEVGTREKKLKKF